LEILAKILVTQNVVHGPSALVSSKSLLTGPIPGQVDQNLHFNKIPGDFYTVKYEKYRHK
jgi:hypothetical protein